MKPKFAENQRVKHGNRYGRIYAIYLSRPALYKIFYEDSADPSTSEWISEKDLTAA